MLNGNTKKAVLRVRDRMRDGAVLQQMHSASGPKWYVVPGREVAPEIASQSHRRA
jgi:hypothetical protein